MQLIFNADDFGLCRGVNLGIIEACQNGVVRSASLMVNMPGSEDAVKLAESAPSLGVGLHLTLTAGQPLTAHKELSDHAGNFLRNQDHVAALPAELIEKEFCAQVRRCMQLGITPTHIDSHHHVHRLNNVSLAFTAVAERYDLPVRQFSQKPGHIKSSEAFDDSYYALSSDDNMGLPRIKQLISPDIS
ncbi:ChbG/HpnK family deacetylase [Endozoicomonas gorgoniicola]|uniref:ChbG/HpnK family deacetylase n=1 Tax=Endozoicomonas gorgoniicola TaxID=1234144 RepID=A0ABT3MYK5_9GAMM|nr:ChbG/HpnK family deacetylase [Endozoicomonas gorgoniicola]MCW7554468.1 ChbG/HpnK family deacetylase [Endozoicomonas gorgoniicola]